MNLPSRIKLNQKHKGEKGSVTLFVLIAMLFFLIIGMMIFIINMNAETSQKRDVEKIKREYHGNTSDSDLELKYQEAKQRQLGKFVIKVIDSYKEIYNSGEWINGANADRLPLTIDANWPAGVASVEIVDHTGTGIRVNSEKALEDITFGKENTPEREGKYQITAQIDNTPDTVIYVNIDLTAPTTSITPNGGTVWKGTEEETIQAQDASNVITLTASDNVSGVKEIQYIINNSSETPAADAEWQTYNESSKPAINNTRENGVYYIHVRAIDNAGNISDITTSEPYYVKQANYKVTTTNGTRYAATLEEAAGIEGATVIRVLRTFTDEVAATIRQNVTLDTNGKTLTMAEKITVASGKTATFVDTAETKGKLERTTGDLVTNSGNVIVNGATMEANTTVINGANVTVNDGTIKSTGNSGWQAIYGINITVNGGNVLANVRYCLSAYRTMNITGGNFSSPTCLGINYCTVNISGNPIINGGTYGIAFGGASHRPTINISGGTITGGTAAIYGGGNETNRGNINITGGTTTGGQYGISLTCPNNIVTIKGGTVTGGINGVRTTNANDNITIGDSSTAIDRTSPVIQGTNGYGVNITNSTSTFNFYDGKIISSSKATAADGKRTFYGREVAFATVAPTEESEETTVNFREGYKPYTRQNTTTNLFETVLEKQVNVTFNPGEGATVAESSRDVLTNVEYKEKAETAENTSLPTPERAGYTFKGWNGKNLFETPDNQTRTSLNYTTTIENGKYTLNGQVSDHASGYVARNMYKLTNGANYANYMSYMNISWTPNIVTKMISAGTYTFSINKLSGNTPPKICYVEIRRYSDGAVIAQIKLHKNETSATFTLNEDTEVYYDIYHATNGQVFDNLSFYVQLEQGTTATAYEPYYVTDNTLVTQDQDHELKAIWEANSYTVHFNANGGTGEMADEAMTYDEAKALTKNTFTKTGYTFAGWSQANEGFENTLVYSSDYEMYAGHSANNNSTREFLSYGNFTNIFDKYGTNAKYRFEFDIKSDDTTNNNKIRVYFSNGSNSKYSFQNNTEDGNVISSNIRTITVSSTEWTHDVFDFRVVKTNQATSNAILSFYGVYGTGNKPRVKNVRLYIIPDYTDEQVVSNLTTENNGTANLYAVWEANNYTVTADANGGSIPATEGWTGSGTSATKSVTYDSTYGTLPTPTKTGYAFRGWKINGEGDNIVADTLVTTPSNHTITAIWEANNYIVTADANGGSIPATEGWTGSGASATKSVTYDSTYGTLPTLTKTGYTFKGWKINGEGDNIAADTIVKTPNDHTITAIWEANNYTVTADANSGSILATEDWTGTGTTATKSVTYDNQYGTLPMPTRDGYDFQNWTGKNLIDSSEEYSKAYNGIVRTNMVVYNEETGIYTVNSKTYYDVLYGHDVMKKIEIGKRYTFSVEIVSKTEGVNTVWMGCDMMVNGRRYTRNTELGCNVGDRLSYSFVIPEGTTSCVVGLINRGSSATGLQYKNPQLEEASTATNFEPYRVVNANTTVSSAADHTIHANWTPKQYTVHFDSNGGTPTPADKTVTFDSAYGTLPTASDVSRTGYTFKGWKINGEGDNIAADTKVTTPSNHTLTAIWEANPYTVTADANGGTIPSTEGWTDTGATSTKSVTFDSQYGTLPTPTRVGYDFAGWYTDATNGILVTDATIMQTDSAHTIYAHWTPRTDTAYTVNHYTHNLGAATYTLNSTDNLQGTSDASVTLADLKKTIAGYTYEEGFITGDTTKPVSGAVATTTIAADGSRVINLYYRPNYLYVQYDMNGGSLSEIHGNIVGVSDNLLLVNNTTNVISGFYGSNVNGVTDINTYSLSTYGLNDYNNPNGINVIKTGYTAKQSLEWNTKADGTGTAYDQFSGSYSAIDMATACGKDLSAGDQVVTLYVNWVPTPYTISYELNGGTVATENPTTYNIETADITLNNPTKIGYTFAGWSEEVSDLTWTKGFLNLSTGVHEISSQYPNSYYTNTIKLKQGVKYTLSGYGSYAVSNIRWRLYNTDGSYYKNGPNSNTYTAEKDCYVRIMFHANPTAEQRSGTKLTSSPMSTVVIQQGSIGNRKYTANYTANTYTVTADANSGSINTTEGWTGSGATATKSVTYDSTYGTLPTPTRTGYTFKGWKINGEGDNIVADTKVTTPSNHTLKAIWEANPYTVTADANGGSIPSTEGWTGTGATVTKSVTFDSQYGTLPTPTRDGYTFLGWYKENTFVNRVETSTQVTTDSDHTIYALWTNFTLSKNPIYMNKTTTSIALIAPEGTSGATVTYTGNNIGELTFESENTNVATVQVNADNTQAAITTAGGAQTGDTTKIIIKDRESGFLLGELNVIIDTELPTWLVRLLSIE